MYLHTEKLPESWMNVVAARPHTGPPDQNCDDRFAGECTIQTVLWTDNIGNASHLQPTPTRVAYVQRNVVLNGHRRTQLCKTRTGSSSPVGIQRPAPTVHSRLEPPPWPVRHVPSALVVPTGTSTIPRPLLVHPNVVQEQAGVWTHLTGEIKAVDRAGSSLPFITTPCGPGGHIVGCDCFGWFLSCFWSKSLTFSISIPHCSVFTQGHGHIPLWIYIIHHPTSGVSLLCNLPGKLTTEYSRLTFSQLQSAILFSLNDARRLSIITQTTKNLVSIIQTPDSLHI